MDETLTGATNGSVETAGLDTAGTIRSAEERWPSEVGPDGPPPAPPPPAPGNIRLPHQPPASPPSEHDVAVQRAVEAALAARGVKDRRKPAEARRSPLSRLSGRTKIAGTVLLTVAATGVVFRAVTPSYPTPEELVAVAARSSAAAAVQSTRAEVDKAKAESTQLIVPDPFAWCRCDLTPTAKAIITYDSKTNYKTLVIDRAQLVSDKAVELIMAGVPPMRIKVVGDGPSGLNVVDGGVEGAALFASPPATTATSPTTTPTSTPAGS